MPPGVAAVGFVGKRIDDCHEFVGRHLWQVVVVDDGAALGGTATEYVAAGWVLVAGAVEAVGEVDAGAGGCFGPERREDVVCCWAGAVWET